MTYQRKDLKEVEHFRAVNFTEIYNNPMRCQKCKGIYFRVWFDQGQCVKCQFYSGIEVSNCPNPKLPNNLLQVSWIKEMVYDDVGMRIKDPVTNRSEFVVHANYFKDRVSGNRTQIDPPIKGYFLIGKAPDTEGDIVSTKEALHLVEMERKEHRGESDNKNGATHHDDVAVDMVEEEKGPA